MLKYNKKHLLYNNLRKPAADRSPQLVFYVKL